MGQSSPTFPQTHNRLAFNMTITNLFALCICLVSAAAGHGVGVYGGGVAVGLPATGYANNFDYGYSVGSGSPGHHSTYTTGYNNYIPARSYTYTYPTVNTVAYPTLYGYGGYAGYGRYGGYGHGDMAMFSEDMVQQDMGMLDMEDMVDMVSPDMDTSLDMVMDYMDMGDKFLL